MKFVIQRVSSAQVDIDNSLYSELERGILDLEGVCQGDSRETADEMGKKLSGLRSFEAGAGQPTLASTDVGGQLLLVSQFTLYADCRKGNRPSFLKAGDPEYANEMYEYIVESCQKQVETVRTGVFGADMKVTLTNDGPFTVVLDSAEL